VKICLIERHEVGGLAHHRDDAFDVRVSVEGGDGDGAVG